MKKIILVLIAFTTLTSVFAQEKATVKKKIDLSNRPSDHLMFQLTNDYWGGRTDSMKTHQKGLSRGLNFAVMMDKPFKNNPHLSAAFGVGISSSNMFFKLTNININGTTTQLPINYLETSNRFKKYKISTNYVEIPVEIRYTEDPLNPKKSLKGALGVKVGTLVNVHTKGKIMQDKNGATLNTDIEKENNKHYFNGTRVAITGRVGYGNFSLFGSYQVTGLLKTGLGPQINPFQIGICISGL